MLKRIATAFIATLALGTPTLAAPAALDRSHAHLWDSLEAQGVWMFVNPDFACKDQDVGLSGAYFYSNEYQVPAMVICQDNRTGGDMVEVEWSANDLDTIRHEAVHYLQDCIDGDVSFTLDPYHDGDGWAPGQRTHMEVISALGLERAIRIHDFYKENMGADDQMVRMEHEAFLIADIIDAADIANTITEFCPVK